MNMAVVESPKLTDTDGTHPEDAAEAKRRADAHIAGLRARIDEIDQTLIELWRERAAISHEVGQTRVAAGGTRLVLAREQEILSRFRAELGADGTQLAMLILRAGRGPLV
jgi:chorismate mutase